MRSYMWAALKLSIDEYEDDSEKFASFMAEVVIFGAEQRGNRAKFVDEVAHVTSQPPTTVERWTSGASVPEPAMRKQYLQKAFDQILAGRP